MFESMKWRAAWMKAMTELGYPDNAMSRGGTNRSNNSPVANAYLGLWIAESGGRTASNFIGDHLAEIAEAVKQPRRD